MFHPWLKSLIYLTAQSLAMLNSSWFALFIKAEKKVTWQLLVQAHWDFVHRQYEFVWKVTSYLLIHNA